MIGRKYVIFNADDLGYSHGINRGILEAHERGVVTSASLMVNTPATAEGVRLARENLELSVGLHVNFTNEAQRLIDLDDEEACRRELWGQYRRFLDLMGQRPTHLDSHQHVHRHPMRKRLFDELADTEGLPLRDRPPVVFRGGFYAQWEYGVSDPSKVSLASLQRILREEIEEGITEVSCHPGFFDPAFEAVYHLDREDELRTLIDPALPGFLEREGIRRISYGQLPAAVRALRGD
ncbi:MAG: ChbG/HpnK family deacetylase [Deltaproteobacteria bacterium]|nr:ChbG/HpnK family deacetylase [Deltaproteobacteria bacterium]